MGACMQSELLVRHPTSPKAPSLSPVRKYVYMHRPLARCGRFVRTWSNAPEPSGAAAAAVLDTNVLGSQRGLSFWRPQAPPGYAPLGDCVTTGTAQPAFQVPSKAFMGS